MDQIEKLVVFAIIMENNQGILGKSPGYIKEKWTSTQAADARWHLENLLANFNLAKYRRWLERWGTHL